MRKTIQFLKYRYIAFGFSIVLLVLFIAGSVMKGGLNMGVDFVGGVKLIVDFPKDVKEKDIKDTLKGLNPIVQKLGSESKNEFMISIKLKEQKKKNESKNKTNKKIDLKEKVEIKTDTVGNKTEQKKEVMTKEAQESEKIKKLLVTRFKNIEIVSVENVGPAIGDFLKNSAIKLFLVALVLMMLYLTFRFEFKYSMGAMAALVHDLSLTVVFCGFMGVEINIPVIAALLTIFGYSVNDTIVIFDRIRENVQVKAKSTFLDTINKSITLSISRTLLTSLTTLFAVLSLYLIGGEGLNEFALVLLFGIFVGTYSSVYIASPLLVKWEQMFSKG